MNIVVIEYIPLGAEEVKKISLSPVNRFYENFAPASKNLTVQIDNIAVNGLPVKDAELAELMSAKIVSINLLGDESDKGETPVSIIITDYTSVHDVRKDYNLNTAAVNLNLSFRMALDGPVINK